MAEVPRHVRASNSSRSSGVSSFGYAPSIVEENEFDTQARARLNGESAFDDSSPNFDDWSPEKQRAGYEGIARADEKRTIAARNADEFLSLNPHILDTNKNATLINKMVKHMFGDVAPTVEQFAAATDALLITNSLDIDKAELVKQQQKADDAQRKATIKRRNDAAARAFNPNAADYENLSLEEIRNRANEELQVSGQQEGAAGF